MFSGLQVIKNRLWFCQGRFCLNAVMGFAFALLILRVAAQQTFYRPVKSD